MAKPKLNSDSKLNFAFNQELHILKDQIWKFSANVYSKCRHIITEFRTNKSTFLDSRATISCQYIDSSLPIYLTSVTKIHIYHPLFLSNSNLRREVGLIPLFPPYTKWRLILVLFELASKKIRRTRKRG